MMKIKTIITGMLLTLVQQAFCQNDKFVKTTIPFSLVENQFIFLQITIKGKLLTFYFDTGAGASLIDRNTALELGITPGDETEVSGAGGKINYQKALNQKIKIQELELDSVSLIFDDLSRLRKSVGIKFDGIIGRDILKRYITEIDFDKQLIYLYPFGIRLNVACYTENSFTFYSGIPLLNTTVRLKNGHEYSGKVLFDSGAGLTLFVNTPFKEKNNLVAQGGKIYSSNSNNLSNKTTTEDIAIDRIYLGEDTFSQLPITLSSDKAGVSSDPDLLGILGNNIINRFNFILNYQTQKLYLKRNSLYNLPFDFPVSGVTLLENEDGEVYVSRISIQSALYKAGIRENDVLVSINGVDKATRLYFTKLLNQENRQFTIEIRRNGSMKKLKGKVQRLI